VGDVLNNWNDHAARSQRFEADCECTPPAGEQCDQYTGYFSKEYGFEGNDGITLKAVTCRHLYSYSDPYYRSEAFTRNFCAKLRYANGEIVPADKLPFPCGSDGPTFTIYNAEEAAMDSISEQLQIIEAETQAALDMRKKIAISVMLVALVVIVLLVLKYRF